MWRKPLKIIYSGRTALEELALSSRRFEGRQQCQKLLTIVGPARNSRNQTLTADLRGSTRMFADFVRFTTTDFVKNTTASN
jgi:hypothetical protein